MAGTVSAPVPWWQLEGGNANAVNNLDASAPPGYQYDRVQMRYVPIMGSPTDALAQRTRQQAIQDQLLRSLSSASFGGGSTSGSVPDYNGGSAQNFGTVSMAASPPPVSFVPPSASAASAGPVTISVPDTSAAQAAIFARAKDQVGQETAGSLTALRSALAGRGLLGGGMETKGTARILTGGQAQLGDTTRQGAIEEATRLNDFAKLGYQGAIEQRGQDITTNEGNANRALQAATTNYTGQINQRGQDVNQNTAAYSGGITQRGQDISASESAANRALTARGQNLNPLTTLLSRLY